MRAKSEIQEWFGSGAELPLAGRIHLVGIGGSGMSAIARILLRQGREVSGSDRELSPTLDDLRSRGADIRIGHDSWHVAGASAVVVSDAIELSSNPETLEARRLEIPMLRRSQVLAFLVRDKKVVAVTGTHGKSSTCAFLAAILADAGLDPFAVIGAAVEGWEGNVRFGKGEIAILEACEAFGGFEDLNPWMVVVTNVEADHLEFHGSYDNLLAAMVGFATQVGPERLIYCSDAPGACAVAEPVGGGTAYGFGLPPLCASYVDGVLKTSVGDFKLPLPGAHMALNALGAVASAILLGVSAGKALESASQSPVCKQRLEVLGEVGDVIVVNDYAHHPTAIRASFDALRESFPGRRLVAVHQPHTFTRTRDLRKEFVEVLATADVIVLTAICAARERPIPGVSATLLAEDLEKLGKEVHYVASRHLLPRVVPRIVKPGDVVTSFGAGNISSFAPDFVMELKRQQEPLRVAVFCGGDSEEREVSIIGGLMVAEALERKGYSVSVYDPNEVLLYWGDTHPLIGPKRPDIVFPVLHGPGGEDGRIQGMLELLHLPYVGSGVLASAIALDKEATKKLLVSHGIRVPGGWTVKVGEPIPPLSQFPCVVKPNSQGSTLGLGFPMDVGELEIAINRALKYDSKALIETFIKGVEISVPVVGAEALPAVEIRPRSGVYDFEAKYTPNATEEIVPARIPDDQAKRASEIALRTHELLGLQDFSRTDMIVADDDIYVLEVNTIPGLTPTSLLPKSAESVGISFDDLCEKILQSAINRYGITKNKA